METTYKSFERALLIFDNTPFRQELEDFMEDISERFQKGLINVLMINSTIDNYAVSSKFTYNKDEATEKVLRYLITERFGLYLGGEYDFKVKILKVDNDRMRVYIDVVRLNDRVSDVPSNTIKTAIELIDGALNSLYIAIGMGSTYMSRTIRDPELYAKIAECDISELEQQLESFADMMLIDSAQSSFIVFTDCNTMEVKVECHIIKSLRK